jgi:stearoyl-CoA desaturase (delta-9 desaturase)
MSGRSFAAAPARDDVQPVAHETVDRIVTGSATVVPFLALGVVGWQAWGNTLRMTDLAIFAVMYVATVLGVTVGFHRHFTHRSFKTTRPVRVVMAVLGSAAVEGPVISWVADHRKHHAFSDREGDPHSPHVGHGGGWRGTLGGLFHAHIGWLFVHDQRGKRSRYAPDLLRDPALRIVDRLFILWVTASLALPFALGWVLGGSLEHALTALLWGGAVRILVLHHVTFSINSLCHFFGRRRFATDDRSRNLAWLALPSMGEAWHNNHHAFPTSAMHGLRPWEIDVSALVIRAMEATGFAWSVQRIPRERQDSRYPHPSPAGASR